jgi:hypothetical protein
MCDLTLCADDRAKADMDDCRFRLIPWDGCLSGGAERGEEGVADDFAGVGMVGFGSCLEGCLEPGSSWVFSSKPSGR